MSNIQKYLVMPMTKTKSSSLERSKSSSLNVGIIKLEKSIKNTYSSTELDKVTTDTDTINSNHNIMHMELNEEYFVDVISKNNDSVQSLQNELLFLILNDEFCDGEISKSEMYIKNAYQNGHLNDIPNALMHIYTSNLENTHILEGVLVMISNIPYEVIEPHGPIMAMGLLSNKNLSIRDKAIQCFEKWNSKKGLAILKSLDCYPKWLQNYVEKVIFYIERDGVE